MLMKVLHKNMILAILKNLVGSFEYTPKRREASAKYRDN